MLQLGGCEMDSNAAALVDARIASCQQIMLRVPILPVFLCCYPLFDGAVRLKATIEIAISCLVNGSTTMEQFHPCMGAVRFDA